MKAQALRDSSMSSYMASKKTLEINPSNAIIKDLASKVKADAADRTVRDLSNILYETAMLTSGFTLDNPTEYATRVHKMVMLGLAIDEDETADIEAEPSSTETPAVEEVATSSMEEIEYVVSSCALLTDC